MKWKGEGNCGRNKNQLAGGGCERGGGIGGPEFECNKSQVQGGGYEVERGGELVITIRARLQMVPTTLVSSRDVPLRQK